MPRAGLDAAAVVRAAGEIADGSGLQSLTLAEVAARLGVRSPSLYAHVGGLDDLRARLSALGAQQMHAELSQAAAGRSGVDALRATLEAYRDFADAHPGLYAASQLAGRSGPAAEAAGARAVEVMYAVLRGYGLEGEAAVHAVRAVRAAVHGFIALHQDGGFGLAVSVQDSWEWMLALIDRGLAAG
jgi:AcrR family transcriptional regulator